VIAVRSKIVSFVLLALLAVLGVGLFGRARSEHRVTAPSASPAASAATSAAPSASAAATSSAAPASSASPASKDKGLGRALRLTGLGWEPLAPVLLANGGLAPKKDSELGKLGLEVSVSVADSPQSVERALARGGADDDGADVAVLPLPAMIAAYERLQALKPVVFFVTGWSRGRDVVTAHEGFDKLPATGEIAVKGSADSAATALALFALDVAGVSPSRVRLGDRGDAKASLRALRRADLADDERGDVVLGTSEANRYVPFVAIAPESLLERHPSQVLELVKGWLAGEKQLAGDPSAAARKISAMPDSPEPIALLSRLGEMQPVGVAENAQLMALSGRDAVNVESLFQRMWRVAREAKLVAIPAPERAPIHTRVLTSLVRSEPSLARPETSSPKGAPKPGTEKPILVERLPSPFDPDVATAEIGFLAGVFERSPIRVTAHRGAGVDKKQTDELVGRTLDRYGLAEGRLTGGKTLSKGAASVTIEVLPVP